MREIKFRAWYRTAGKMCIVESLQFAPNATNILVTDKSGAHYLLNADEAKIMQYTGLHDSNGKEIYEGDVLDCVNGDVKTSDKSFYPGRCLGQVGFVGASFIVWPRPVVDGRRMHYGCEVLSDGLTKYTWENEVAAGESTVVGNIWENGDLLDNKNTETN